VKKVLIIAANYMDLEISSNNRTNFIPQYLYDQGYQVEMITSDFNHHRKSHVDNVEKREYKLTVLHENGYKKNVSFKRLVSIRKYVKNLKCYLKSLPKVDFVYCFVPPHSVAQVAGKYAKKVGAEFVIDVRDLWPEAFKMIIKNKILYNLLFLPLVAQANRTYKMADKIVAVSETYLHRALKVNTKNSFGLTIYIGTNLQDFDIYKNMDFGIRKPNNEIWVVYAGTLGNSYDLRTVFRAFKILKDNDFKYIKLHVLGNGPLEDYFNELSNYLELDVKFYGRLPYNEMVSFLCKCDIVLNPLVPGASQSLINKHADYAASGLPVISTQITEEYVDLIGERKMGYNVDTEDYSDMADKILILSNNETLRKEMGRNHRKFAEEKMDRHEIYSKLLGIF